MLEYIFFNQAPFDRFVAHLRELGVSPSTAIGDEGWLVAVPEDLDERVGEQVESFYDRLMDADRELVEADVDDLAGEYSAAGVTVQLSDGRRVYAEVAPALLMKISQCLDGDELGAFVAAICDAVEHPDERGFCQRMRDGEGG